MFLKDPEPTWNEADLIIFFPSKTSDRHFKGFNVRSRSRQISFRASAWSVEEDEIVGRSFAKPLTLCGLERVSEVSLNFVGRYHLSVPRAGFHISVPSD